MKRFPLIKISCIIIFTIIFSTQIKAQKVDKYFSEEEYTKAEEYCSKQKTNKKEACLLELVKAYIAVEKLPEAKNVAERLSNKGPAYFEFGKVYIKSGQFEIAERYFNMSDNNLQGYVMLADTLYMLKNYSHSLVFYKKAYENNETELHTAYEKIADGFLLDYRTLDKAAKYYEIISEGNDKKRKVLYAKLADAYVEWGQLNVAEKYYKLAYNDQPELLKNGYDKMVAKIFKGLTEYYSEVTKYGNPRLQSLLVLREYYPKSSLTAISPKMFKEEVDKLESLINANDFKYSNEDLAYMNMNVYLLQDIQDNGDEYVQYYNRSKAVFDTLGPTYESKNMLDEAIFYYSLIGVRDPESQNKAGRLTELKSDVIDPYSDMLEEVFYQLAYMNSPQRNAELLYKLLDTPEEYSAVWLTRLNDILIKYVNHYKEISLFDNKQQYSPEMLFVSDKKEQKVLLVAVTTNMSFGANYIKNEDSSAETKEKIIKVLNLFHKAYNQRYEKFMRWGDMYSPGERKTDMYNKAKVYLNNMELLNMQLRGLK